MRPCLCCPLDQGDATIPFPALPSWVSNKRACYRYKSLLFSLALIKFIFAVQSAGFFLNLQKKSSFFFYWLFCQLIYRPLKKFLPWLLIWSSLDFVYSSPKKSSPKGLCMRQSGGWCTDCGRPNQDRGFWRGLGASLLLTDYDPWRRPGILSVSSGQSMEKSSVQPLIPWRKQIIL